MAALGEWLLDVGSAIEKTPVGLVTGVQEIALATQERGWVIPLDSPIGSIVIPMLRNLLLAQRTGPALVVLDTPSLVEDLERKLGPFEWPLLRGNIIHDMRVLEYTTGRPVLREGTVSPLKLALDASAVGPMMALEAPRFYLEVGLPLAKHAAQGFTINEGWHRWTVIYDWLLFRVLAHFTHDPSIIQWLKEERNPLTELGERLELGPEETVAFLLWLCCGEDDTLLGEKHPFWVGHLPESPQFIKSSRADKHIPTLRMGLIRIMEQATTAPRVQTLYGRRSVWGVRPSELLHFLIFGSVNDLLDVAMVSLINLGSQNHWLLEEEATTYSRWLRSIIVGYNEEEPIQWQENLEQLLQLNNPLGVVPLQPKVVVE